MFCVSLLLEKLYSHVLISQVHGMIPKLRHLLIAKVIENIGEYKICVDQGFSRTGDLLSKFVGPISRRSRLNLPRREVIRQHNKYVSLRQSSKWGMRALQGTFIRMKSRLPAN